MEFADDAEKSFTNALTVLQVRFTWTLVKYTFSIKHSNLVFVNNLIQPFWGSIKSVLFIIGSVLADTFYF